MHTCTYSCFLAQFYAFHYNVCIPHVKDTKNRVLKQMLIAGSDEMTDRRFCANEKMMIPAKRSQGSR
jgi:hypothetical protein